MASAPDGNGRAAVRNLGYAGGPDGAAGSGLNGYVGERPAVREEPQNPQSLRQHTNFASPDPNLARSAFTQSQFVTNVSAAALQSQAMRGDEQTGAGLASQQAPEDEMTVKRREGLRRYKEGTGQRRNGGSACGWTPSPSMTFNRARPQNGRGDNDDRNNQLPNTNVMTMATGTTSVAGGTPGSASNGGSGGATTVCIGYTLADAGSMYKAFSGATRWFRVMQMIVPPGKVAKRVLVACMMVIKSDDGANGANGSGAADVDKFFSLRLVDSANPQTPLFAKYDCDNSDNFKVYTMDLSSSTSSSSLTGGLLELQAQNASGLPILFSSAILEFQ